MLTKDKLLEDIIEILVLNIKPSELVSYEDAVEIVKSNPEFAEDLSMNDDEISNSITSDNANNIAYKLASGNPTVATALLEELLYWRTKNSI